MLVRWSLRLKLNLGQLLTWLNLKAMLQHLVAYSTGVRMMCGNVLDWIWCLWVVWEMMARTTIWSSVVLVWQTRCRVDIAICSVSHLTRCRAKLMMPISISVYMSTSTAHWKLIRAVRSMLSGWQKPRILRQEMMAIVGKLLPVIFRWL